MRTLTPLLCYQVAFFPKYLFFFEASLKVLFFKTKKLLALVIQFYSCDFVNVIYKPQKGLDSSTLCGGPLIQKRNRTTIVGWRLSVVFWLLLICLWSHHIGCLAWPQLHSISPSIMAPSEKFDKRRLAYNVMSR